MLGADGIARRWRHAPMQWLDGDAAPTKSCTVVDIYYRVTGTMLYNTWFKPQHGTDEVVMLARGAETEDSQYESQLIGLAMPHACAACVGKLAKLAYTADGWRWEYGNSRRILPAHPDGIDRVLCERCQAHEDFAGSVEAFITSNPSAESLRAAIAHFIVK